MYSKENQVQLMTRKSHINKSIDYYRLPISKAVEIALQNWKSIQDCSEGTDKITDSPYIMCFRADTETYNTYLEYINHEENDMLLKLLGYVELKHCTICGKKHPAHESHICPVCGEMVCDECWNGWSDKCGKCTHQVENELIALFDKVIEDYKHKSQIVVEEYSSAKEAIEATKDIESKCIDLKYQLQNLLEKL